MSGQPVTGSSYGHANANGSLCLKAGKGSLFTVTINQKGASSNILTIYDNIVASGTIIAAIDTTAGVETLEFNLDFQNGLSYTLSAGTAADVTFSFS